MSATPVVYDCMIFLQAAARPERIYRLFQLVSDGQVTLHISAQVLAEIGDVLGRPEHRSKFPALTPERVTQFLDELLARSQLVEAVPDSYVVQRDPDDSPYVNLAIVTKAKYLVTYDRDLLDLMSPDTPDGREFRDAFPSLEILTPAAFLREMERSE